MRALAQALGLKPDDLLPDLPNEPTVPAAGMDAQVNAETGRVWLRLNQSVTFDKAQRIMSILAENDKQPG